MYRVPVLRTIKSGAYYQLFFDRWLAFNRNRYDAEVRHEKLGNWRINNSTKSWGNSYSMLKNYGKIFICFSARIL